MVRAAVTLLLAVSLRGAVGAATVAADTAPHGRQGHHSAAAPSHGEGAELHRTAGHAHHATAAADLARRKEHAPAAHAKDAAEVVEKGAEVRESGDDVAEASPEAEPEEDAQELEAAEDDAEGLEGPEEGPPPQRSRRHEIAVDAAGEAAELAQGGGAIMRRHNHTKGADFDEGYLDEEESLVQEDVDLEEQAKRSGWWSRRRFIFIPPPPPPKIHCAWASWGKWTTCSATCGQGKQSATRGHARAAKNGGFPCQGPAMKSQTCQIKKCTTTSTTTTSTTTTTTTTTTKKPLVKAGATRPAGVGVPALLLALAAARHLL